MHKRVSIYSIMMWKLNPYIYSCVFLIALWENLYFIFYPFKPRLGSNKVGSVK